MGQTKRAFLTIEVDKDKWDFAREYLRSLKLSDGDKIGYFTFRYNGIDLKGHPIKCYEESGRYKVVLIPHEDISDLAIDTALNTN